MFIATLTVLCTSSCEGGHPRSASVWGRGWGVAYDYVNKLVQFASRSRVGRGCVRIEERLTYGRWIKRYRDQNDMLPMTLSITTNSTSVNVLYTISNVKKIFFLIRYSVRVFQSGMYRNIDDRYLTCLYFNVSQAGQSSIFYYIICSNSFYVPFSQKIKLNK